MSEKNPGSNKTIPLLFSEKTILMARSFSPQQDPFIGLIEGRLHHSVNKVHLSKAYQYLISSKTTFQLLFEAKKAVFSKSLQTPAFKDITEFKNEEAFSIWKNINLDFETGPLQEMAIYKTFFKSILCFKFHHLILDGFSLFIFFKELTEAYHKSVSGKLKEFAKNDFKTYQQFTENLFKQERENRKIKNDFWKKHLKIYQKDRTEKTDCSKKLKYSSASNKKDSLFLNSVKQEKKAFTEWTKKEGSEIFFLGKKHLKKIYNFKNKENIGLFYIFSSLYSKALKETFDISSICLRVPFSSRHHLEQKEQKNLLISLSRSMPLFINQPLSPLKELALEIQKQARAVRNYLIMDIPPWKRKQLQSFSERKNQTLSLSMSYLPYTEKGFLGVIQNFYWKKSFLDLVLFVILSEKRVLLSFSYKPEIFSKKEIKLLSTCFQKKIEKI